MLWGLQEEQSGVQVLTEAAGFATIVIGTFLLHATKDLDVSSAQASREASYADSALLRVDHLRQSKSKVHAICHTRSDSGGCCRLHSY